MSLHLLLLLSFFSPHSISQQVSLLLDQQFFHYQEFSDTGDVLDTEKGWLYGPLIHYEHQYTSGFELTLSASLLTGTLTYEGHTQAGKPHNTNTKENIQRFNIGLSYPLTPTYGVGVKVERFIWDRDIQANAGVLGLHEVYSWSALSFHQNIHITHFDIGLSISKLLNGNIAVDLSEVNKGEIDIPLHPGTQLELEVKYKKNIAQRTYLTTRISGLWRYFEKSDAQRSGNSLFFEPENRAVQIGAALGILYSF